MTEDLGTIERLKMGGITIKDRHDTRGFVVGNGAAVEHPTLIEQLYTIGFLGKGNEARRRKEAGMWLTDLMEQVYSSEGVAGYSIMSSAEYEMSDDEAETRAVFTRVMRQIVIHDWRLLKIMTHDHNKDLIPWTARHMVGEPEGYHRALDKLANVMRLG